MELDVKKNISSENIHFLWAGFFCCIISMAATRPHLYASNKIASAQFKKSIG